ncbi:MAG TPA: hypothetical protein VL400_25185 [Polyangiaceae bacterium]|jgi:hypothetical protein|nr:hypothetical protein [Polyangiaceae bacterium]
MGAERRIQEFEAWSRGRGRASREADRRRIVAELYELSADRPVTPEHVEALVKKYRDGLMGANAILHARTVADDLMLWQDELGADLPEDAPPRSDHPPPAPRSERPSARESQRVKLSSDAWSRPAERSPSSIPPRRADTPLGKRVSTGSRKASDDTYGRSPLGGSSPPEKKKPSVASLDDFPPLSARRDIFDALDEVEGLPRSERPPPFDDSFDHADSERPARHSSRPALGSASTRPSPRLSSRPPARLDSEPPGERRSPLPRRGSSRPPPSDDAFDELVDKAPKKFAHGFDRPPSIRPKTGVQVEESDEGVVHGRASRRSDEISESVAPPPVRPPLTIFRPEDEPAPSLSRRLMVWGGLALPVVGLLGFVLTRPGCSPLYKSNAPASGTFRSKHLGAQIDFSEPWMHDETLDDRSEASGWERRVSIFFRGTSASDFTSQLVVVVFSRKDLRAGTAEANQLGANETLGVILNRHCEPYQHPGGDLGTVCSGLTVRGAQRLAAIEAYFPMQGRAVFVRFLFEMPATIGPNAVDATELRQGDPLLDALNRKTNDALATLATLRPLG